MLTAEFWTALERVGALALLAVLLWIGWRYIRDKEGKEHTRIGSLVEFIQQQVEDGRQAQALYVAKLEETHTKHTEAFADLVAHMIECTMTTNQALRDIGSGGTEEHEAILDAVMSFDELRHTATQEHKAILRAVEELEQRVQAGHQRKGG